MSWIVPRLCSREALEPSEFVLLLDWLDKVRIGLWLAQWYLMKNPLGISPHFAINNRVGARDRMVAVYPFSNQPRGLNAFGTETLLFQLQPSVFGLRVNDVLMINASWEWMCAARTGFAYPTKRWVSADSAAIIATEFRWRREPRHPIYKGLIKPSVALFQPALHELEAPLRGNQNDAYATWCATSHWPNNPGLGPLFRQHSGKTIQVNPQGPPIEFDSISEGEGRSFRKTAVQTYLMQIDSIACNHWLSVEPERARASEHLQATVIKLNRQVLQAFRTVPRRDQGSAGSPKEHG